MADEEDFQFLPGDGDLSGDPRLSLMAACICNQQRAGFKNRIDLREAHCPTCGSAGFNTGWGYFEFACGAQILTDGEPSEPCEATL